MTLKSEPVIPNNQKIYHIVHVDRIPSIILDNFLWCDAEAQQRKSKGTTIGMDTIKERRLKTSFSSYPKLNVGECVPFYFCPRSVMLYMFHKNNHQDITYHGGQELIVHLVADLQTVAQWADKNNQRWVFTDSNAGSSYFNDFATMNQLNEVNWDAVRTNDWSECRDNKQAEFLIEKKVPWELIECIGVFSVTQEHLVNQALLSAAYRPSVQAQPNWYY